MNKTHLGSVTLSLMAFGAFTLLSACGGGSPSQEEEGPIISAKPIADQNGTTAATSPVGTAGQPKATSVLKDELGSTCKKYIGELMGRPESSMNIDRIKSNGAIVAISYIRPDDRKLFKYECRLNGKNIVWRGVDIFTRGEGPGRWRDEDAKPVSAL